MNAFELRTERLLIRAWSEDDRAGFSRLVSDPQMMRFINDGQPMSEALSEHFLSRQQRSLAQTGTCIGAMLQADTGELIGAAGMQALDRVARLDLAWWVSPGHSRRGYAIEAAVAVCRDAFERLRQPLVFAAIDRENTASRAVARKLGMRFESAVIASDHASWRLPAPIDVYSLRPTQLLIPDSMKEQPQKPHVDRT